MPIDTSTHRHPVSTVTQYPQILSTCRHLVTTHSVLIVIQCPQIPVPTDTQYPQVLSTHSHSVPTNTSTQNVQYPQTPVLTGTQYLQTLHSTHITWHLHTTRLSACSHTLTSASTTWHVCGAPVCTVAHRHSTSAGGHGCIVSHTHIHTHLKHKHCHMACEDTTPLRCQSGAPCSHIQSEAHRQWEQRCPDSPSRHGVW